MEKMIYYHDTDAGGVVYYANYLKYMEEARVEFFNQRGLSESSMESGPVFFPVRSCVITYYKPAWYGETIRCSAEVQRATAARVVFQQRVVNAKTGELLTEAEVTLACVDARSFKPIRIPDDFQARLLSKGV